MRKLRIAMAQINPTVGDLKGNAARIIHWAGEAAGLKCDLVLFPELALTGYPPEDLLLKPRFINDNLAAMKELGKKIRGVTAVVGFVDRKGRDIYNAAAIVHNGRIADVYHKMFLPNYGVFDEKRYFRAGETALNFVLNGVRIGLEICEDIWRPEGPARAQSGAGAEALVNINASPYHMGKAWTREEMLISRARENKVFVAYNNTVGGQDELVFDGQGMIIGPTGGIIARGTAFEEELITADLEFRDPARKERKRKGVREAVLKGVRTGKKPRLPARAEEQLDAEEEVLRGLVMGTRDYVHKNGFRHVLIGLSGGIDSSLVAAIASRALGGRNITGVLMPSDYTSRESGEDARRLAKNLGIEVMTVPITRAFKSYLRTLNKPFRGTRPDTTEENMQARIRGNILMALSNKFGWLVLTTGNKSEMSVGYAT
ncbi:MAG: NAD+ synthase, partial [Deltaproteobacteria bacterium]|nr:NAD+ synthase [Deltaproteobacteria bacterium]